MSILIYGASGSLVRERYFAYSADHNSVTITDGSGANAISHTVYTDSDGHAVLSVAYPSANTTEFTLNQFDVVGNLISAQHDSSVNGAVTTWTTANYSFDGLNRMTSKIDRDNAPTTYAYDSMGDLTNCTMPGNLQWQASYNNAGQILQEQNFGGGNPTRTTTYSYYSSGNAFAGLLQTKTDGRGTSCTTDLRRLVAPHKHNLQRFSAGAELDHHLAIRAARFRYRHHRAICQHQHRPDNDHIALL